ncbi:M14 family zinc carboxypeptidase [Xylophilus sp. ASV27]|uniref:M14 family zinc carboxypeptidase n=1 Tax=Xylophilus sp. ASV27 TaxID=2795129 RepID=UPI0018EBDBBD|nr:M14 family zinc carboxypeptidase [Xylophilus sp. ASV27]
MPTRTHPAAPPAPALLRARRRPSSTPAWLRGAAWSVPLALLTACSSTPLPPWQSGQGVTGTDATPAVVVRPAAPPVIDMSPPGAVVIPVAPTGLQPAPSSVTPPEALAPPPYADAVAARFPDPSVRYSTPGLQAERTSFTTNAEVHAWLSELSAMASGTGGVRAGLLPIGRSQRGEPLEALMITRSANTEPGTLAADGRPTVLLIGQQHGDEPAGSEALLIIAREASQGLLEPLLNRINVIVVPRANPDGAAAGTRTTANGIDMNRDHLLLRTPEAQALARLVRDYRPMVVVDAHEYTVAGRFLQKFGGIQRYDGLLQYATTGNLPEFVTKASEEWVRRPLVAALNRQSLSNEWYYTTSTDPEDRRVSMGGVQPDTGRNVNGLKNAVSLLLETRGVGIGRLHIQRRVHTHVTAVASVLQSTAARADDLKQLRSFVERDVSALACREDAVIEAGPTPGRRTLLMLDPQTGADRSIDVAWNSSLTLRTLKSRKRPCGYWLSSTATPAVDRLRMMGVQVMRVMEPGSLLLDTYRETARNNAPREDVRGSVADGAAGDIARVEVALTRSLIDVPEGSYYVPLGQPLGNLAVAALEPDTQNSFFANHVIDGLDALARVAGPPPASLRLEDMQP